MFGDKVDPLEDTVRFLRITLLGSQGCGKTSLISAFVNSACPPRCPPTESPSIYYRKLDLREEEVTPGLPDKPKTVFLEIEDTPASEKAFDSFSSAEDRNPLQIKKGSRVGMKADKKEVIAAFHRYRQTKGRALKYERGMDVMLGNDFTVKSVGDDTFGLQSQEGGDIWEVPAEILTLKLGIDLPIDPFLDLGEKPKPVIAQIQERKKHVAAQQRPLSSYERPIGAPTSDKSVSKSRMGYLICFDCSDEDLASFKEAKKVYQLLENKLKKRHDQRANPIIWFVACKSDKTSNIRKVEQTMSLARSFLEDEDIPLKVTSARRHEGVRDVFYEMAGLIEGKVPLWRYVDNDGDENDDEDESGNCSIS